MMENSDPSGNRPADPARSAELRSLLAALVDGELTDDQFQRLEGMLADDPQARADYHRQLQMHALLMYGHMHEETASQTPVANQEFNSAETFAEYVYRTSNQAVWQSELQRDAAFFRDLKQENPPPPIPDLSPLPELGEASQSVIRTYLPWFTTGILGMTLLAVIAVSWILPNENTKTAAVGASSNVPSVHILSGTTKLMLPGIGNVMVNGPAEFDMLGPMRARLARGKIKVHVTEKSGYGFVVETPYGNVTDLGTEFGLDVSDQGQVGLAVFDGAVDLQVPGLTASAIPAVERFTKGDGVLFGKAGTLQRMGAIRRDDVGIFTLCGDVSDGSQDNSTIVNVTDNIHESDSKKFYEIVSGGLRENALVYVDRFFTFKPLTGEAACLEGADYVKMFNDDRYHKDMKISVTLSRPAKLYVIFDSRLDVPQWLSKDFRQLETLVYFGGSNTRNSRFRFTTGFSVWERVVQDPGTVELGHCYAGDSSTRRVAMYSIAAVPLEAPKVIEADTQPEDSSKRAAAFEANQGQHVTLPVLDRQGEGVMAFES